MGRYVEYFLKELRECKKVILLVFFWLAIVNIFGLLALNRFSLKADDAYGWIPVERYNQHQEWNIVNFHARWDSSWYFDLADKGYARYENDTLSNTLFFPVYPFLMKAISVVLGVKMAVSGWATSLFFLFLAAVYLFKLAKEFHKETDALFSVFLLLIFPTAFFLNAVYTESLFLFLSVASFYYAMKRHYMAAAILGLFASLTRITGILLFLPLLIQLFSAEGLTKKSVEKSVVLGLIPLGTLAFFTYHWARFGDFLLFFKVENAWGRSFRINPDHFLVTSRAAISNLSLDVVYFVFVIFIIAILLRKRYFPYAVYMASTVLVAVGSGTLMSIGRYILVLFPIFLVGASMKNDLAKYAWIIISGLLMALNTILFVNWYWAG